MAPRQNTFMLVPNPLGVQGLVSRPAGAPPNKPPMTSRQAQKLYKQSTKQPRRSKAEQRRIEREEQERIRKELDKEKQATKARMAREKKKAKEQQALDEKKRKGLPLVNVRPSQDTIARFVRGNGLGKKRDSAGAEMQLETVAERGNTSSRENTPYTESADYTSPKKRQRASQSTLYDTEEQLRGTKASPLAPQQDDLQQDDLRQDVDKRAGQRSANVGDTTTEAGAGAGAGVGAQVKPSPGRNTAPKNSEAEESGGVTTRPVPVPVESPVSIPVHGPPPLKPQPVETQCLRVVQKQVTRKPLQETSANPSRSERLAAPPNAASRFAPAPPAMLKSGPGREPWPMLPAFKQLTSPTEGARVYHKPKFLPRHVHTPPARLAPATPATKSKGPGRKEVKSSESAPPTSTQLFVMSHLDDLFPTPSQEARELQDLHQDTPLASVTASRSAIACESPSVDSDPAPRQLTSQPVGAHFTATHAPRLGNSRLEAVKAVIDTAVPFFSTQDFILSSQDIRDLEQTTETPTRPQSNPGQSSSRGKLQPLPKDNCAHALTPPWKPESWKAESRKPQSRKPQSSLRSEVVSTRSYETSPRPSPHLPVLDQKDTQPAGPAASSRSPPRRRFFTSSGSGAEYLLAVERSRQSHQKEQWMRELEQRQRNPGVCAVEEESNWQQSKQRQQQQQKADSQLPCNNTEAQCQSQSPHAGAPAPSQETDYGDLDEVDLLDVVGEYFGVK
ncbi:hypothetical protein QBC46DRAFT_375111 [Diplogelasinospora grovesii]|uniref:Uncharacterized protein n=1 Tax=Diplogelasinospora grovesii TaxID=303347 RepID=A0AAN6NEK3_9PEZI|nr:hypothetical protein QBC46DRAFT_375111 [Diplogelasinospora grovesii]